MKFIKTKNNADIRHQFELAGRRAIIRITDCFLNLGLIGTEVIIGKRKPVRTSLIAVATKAMAEQRMRQVKADRRVGVQRPDVTTGEITDLGDDHVGAGVRELCAQVGLDPDDCTSYDYVSLSVRVAGLALARKIVLNHAKKRASASCKTLNS